MGCGDWGAGRTGSVGAAGASTATAETSREISASNGERAPGCNVTAINRERTSSAAQSDAALVCARSSGESALVGLLLLQAETTSATECCSSSELRCMRSRLSRRARATACSIAFGSFDMTISTRLGPQVSQDFILVLAACPVNPPAVPLCPVKQSTLSISRPRKAFPAPFALHAKSLAEPTHRAKRHKSAEPTRRTGGRSAAP